MERGGGRESVAVDGESAIGTVSQRRVAMEVAGLAVWCAAQRRTKLTDEQVPLPLSTLALALPLEQGTIGPDHRHRPKPIRPLCPPVDGVDTVDSGGQQSALKSAVAPGKQNGSCASFRNQIEEWMVRVEKCGGIDSWGSNKHSGRRDGGGFRAFFIHLDGGILTNKAQA